MDPQLQVFAIKLMKKILPDVERLVDTYIRDPDEGFSAYHDFITELKPFQEKIVLEGKSTLFSKLISLL